MKYDWGKISALIANETKMAVNLSSASVQLILTAIQSMMKRYSWTDDSQGDWDEIESLIAQACEDMMCNAFIAMVVPTAGNIPPHGLPCDGSLYNRSDYELLYSALDPAYIVSATQFRTPDLEDRFVLAEGSRNTNDTGGSERVTLSESEMPSHSHRFSNYTYGIDVEGVGVPDPTGVGQPKIPTEVTQSSGGGNSHENMPPFIVLKYYIVAR